MSLDFEYGKTYKDEIWCDIVPMDACHVLLGRPWLFDRGVMHDGHMNTYTFTKDHKKITLTPPKISSLSKPKDNPKLDVFLTTLLKSQCMSMNHSKSGFYLAKNLPKPRPHLTHYSPLTYMTSLMSSHKKYPMAYPQDDPPNTK